MLDVQQAAQGVLVVLELEQLFQLCRVLFPAGADLFRDKGGQGGVAVHQPPAEGDAVGLVVELLRVQLGKGFSSDFSKISVCRLATPLTEKP